MKTPGLLLFVFLLMGWMGDARAQDEGEEEQPPELKRGPVVQIPLDSPKLREIESREVKAESLPDSELEVPGRVALIPTHSAKVALPMAGRLLQIPVAMGDRVTKGQPVLEVRSPEAEKAITEYIQAKASLSQAKASLVKAQADLDRTKDLFEHGAIPQKELLNAQAASQQGAAAVDAAEAGLGQTLNRLEFLGLDPESTEHDLWLKSPMDGKVIEITAAPGEYRSETSEPVLTIASLREVWIHCEVPENSIRIVKEGQTLLASLGAFPGEDFPAQVKRIGDRVDPKTHTIAVIAEVKNPEEKLRPDMYAQIRLLGERGVHPVIPSEALLQDAGRKLVFVQKDPGVFEMREVRVTREHRGRLAVIAGVEAGERVVVDGTMLLKGEALGAQRPPPENPDGATEGEDSDER